MASFLKKALGVFVEFDETAEAPTNQVHTPVVSDRLKALNFPESTLEQGDVEKFEKHFDKLFEETNFPGPDYFEFWKMMETLEKHIPDETSRISGVFASLSIQGLTKEKLLQTAQQYKTVIEQDHTNFNNAVNSKSETDILARKKSIEDYDNKIAANAQEIQRLTKEITELQIKSSALKEEINQENAKLEANTKGYAIAYLAMIKKIDSDIVKIQNTL